MGIASTTSALIGQCMWRFRLCERYQIFFIFRRVLPICTCFTLRIDEVGIRSQLTFIIYHHWDMFRATAALTVKVMEVNLKVKRCEIILHFNECTTRTVYIGFWFVVSSPDDATTTM